MCTRTDVAERAALATGRRSVRMTDMVEQDASRATRRNLGHRLMPMLGRDPNEAHRQATPLELLFDLAFVVAFGIAGEQFAHLYAEGHYAAGLLAFSFAT